MYMYVSNTCSLVLWDLGRYVRAVVVPSNLLHVQLGKDPTSANESRHDIHVVVGKDQRCVWGGHPLLGMVPPLICKTYTESEYTTPFPLIQ